MLLFVKVSFPGHIALLKNNKSDFETLGICLGDLVKGNVSADTHQDVHERLIMWRAVNGGTERLDKPGTGLRGAEAVVIPERGLDLKMIRLVIICTFNGQLTWKTRKST